ncbi:hypothetical protein SAMN05660479_02296 [Microbulbifer thermotolerans]|nr:hypothetical protein SAMN05660479_02296 [Microbulbifer thermotolerans]
MDLLSKVRKRLELRFYQLVPKKREVVGQRILYSLPYFFYPRATPFTELGAALSVYFELFFMEHLLQGKAALQARFCVWCNPYMEFTGLDHLLHLRVVEGQLVGFKCKTHATGFSGRQGNTLETL